MAPEVAIAEDAHRFGQRAQFPQRVRRVLAPLLVTQIPLLSLGCCAARLRRIMGEQGDAEMPRAPVTQDARVGLLMDEEQKCNLAHGRPDCLVACLPICAFHRLFDRGHHQVTQAVEGICGEGLAGQPFDVRLHRFESVGLLQPQDGGLRRGERGLDAP